jgi:hypothetical protein
MLNFDLAWNHYLKNTGARDAYGDPFHFTSLKIQKTLTYRRLSCLAY